MIKSSLLPAQVSIFHLKKNSQTVDTPVERKRAETLHVFSEQVDKNIAPWLRNARPNVEAPVQPNKTVEECIK